MTGPRLIPSRGGKVLKRALFSALNLIPGKVGRYEVDLVGPRHVVLSEHITSGKLPLVLLAHGSVVWPEINRGAGGTCIPTSGELLLGSPFKRQGAILKILTGNMLSEVGYSVERDRSLWLAGYPDCLTQDSEDPTYRFPGLSGYHYGMTGSPIMEPWQFDMAAVPLCDEVLKRTYLGHVSRRLTGVTAETSAAATVLERAASCLRQACAAYMEPDEREDYWNMALAAGFNTPGETLPAPANVLAEIGLRPEIWNDETDPGGQGEESGEGGGRRRGRNRRNECGYCNDGYEGDSDDEECADCGRTL